MPPPTTNRPAEKDMKLPTPPMPAGPEFAASTWGGYSGLLLLAQATDVPIIHLTIGHAILAGCMAGGTIGALIWNEKGDKDHPNTREMVLRWVACFSCGGALTPMGLYLLTKYTALPLRPEVALCAAFLASLSGWWLVQYLRAQGAAGLLSIARNVLDALKGKKPE